MTEKKIRCVIEVVEDQIRELEEDGGPISGRLKLLRSEIINYLEATKENE